MTDSITILIALSGVATKTFLPGGKIIPHSTGRLFRHVAGPVTSIHDLARVLIALESVPQAMIIRGGLLSGVDPGAVVYRRKFGEAACFREVSRRWLCVDIDALPCPEGVSSISEQAVRYAISHLPDEFHDASVFWQLSASAGRDPSVIKVHLWAWLDEPVADADLRAWARAWNDQVGFRLIDPALYNAVQPHYVAAPRFIGVPDPVAVRSGLIHG